MWNSTRGPVVNPFPAMVVAGCLVLVTAAGCRTASDRSTTPGEVAPGAVPTEQEVPLVATTWREGDDTIVEVNQAAYATVLSFVPGCLVERLNPVGNEDLVLKPGVNRLRPPQGRRVSPSNLRNCARAGEGTPEHGRLVVLASLRPLPLVTTDVIRDAVGRDFMHESWPVASVERLMAHIDFDARTTHSAVAYFPR